MNTGRRPTRSVRLGEQRNGQNGGKRRDHDRCENGATADMKIFRRVRKTEHAENEEGSVLCEPGADGQQDSLLVVFENLQAGKFLQLAFFGHVRKHRRFLDGQTDQHSNHDQHDADQERATPSPAFKVFRSQRREQGHYTSRQNKPRRNSELRPRAIAAPLVGG
jgi:hypothetical protein